jgi:alanyl-tRNA synthetase
MKEFSNPDLLKSPTFNILSIFENKKIVEEEMKDKIETDLIEADKIYHRGESHMKLILTKQYKVLSGEDCLSLFNTYGLPVKYLKILILSHGYKMNEKEFMHLLLEQEERHKNTRQCKNDTQNN